LEKAAGDREPSLLIPNYVLSMSNCVEASDFYSICCLNECDGIFQHLEARIQAPVASKDEITHAIEEGITLSPLLSSTVHTEARNLSATLRTKLEEVASYHYDMIPLHGRLFAQWLHYAFPRECPYPHMSGTLSRRSGPSQTEVTEDEIKQHIESEAGRRAPSPEAGQSMWSPQEELLVPSHSHHKKAGGFLRQPVLIVILVLFSAMVLKELKRVYLIMFCKEVPFAGYDI